MSGSLFLRRGAAIGAVAIALCSSPAFAQDGKDRILTIGAGPQTAPRFIGSDENSIGFMPVLNLRRVGAPLSLETPDEGAGTGFLGSSSAFDFGPSVVIQNERSAEDLPVPIGEIDTSVELGGFVEVRAAPWVRLRAEARKAVSGHDGVNGDVMLDFVHRTKNSVFSIGPRARIADERFHQAYFGVTGPQALATGLPVYSPEGGVHAVGAVTTVTHQFNERWGMYGYAGYDRLVGDAADSPFIKTHGSRDQFSAGIAVTYSFRVRTPF
jgi:outer membrane protein